MISIDPRRAIPTDRDLRDYDRLTRAWGFIDFRRRTQIEVRGNDRQRFLHNLCTNDIQGLQPSQGCEAFVTNVQGKCLGHVLVFAGGSSLVIETSPDQAATLLAHLARYHISEDIELIDRGDDWTEWLVSGPSATAWTEELTSGEGLETLYAHRPVKCEGVTAWIRRVSLTAEPGYLLACEMADLNAVQSYLESRDAICCSATAFHMARIEHGFPWYGWDITDRNFPQEVNRNSIAISFRKGCYLGQETVARIDSVGHVNRLAVAVQCATPEVPQIGDPLSVAGNVVGEVTSAAESPQRGAPLALAYVRREFAEAGATLALPLGNATVVSTQRP